MLLPVHALLDALQRPLVPNCGRDTSRGLSAPPCAQRANSAYWIERTVCWFLSLRSSAPVRSSAIQGPQRGCRYSSEPANTANPSAMVEATLPTPCPPTDSTIRSSDLDNLPQD